MRIYHVVQDVLGVDFSGSTFVAVSGHDDHPNHTQLILRAAAAMLAVAAATPQADGSPLAVRVGIHTGPLTTGAQGRVTRDDMFVWGGGLPTRHLS